MQGRAQPQELDPVSSKTACPEKIYGTYSREYAAISVRQQMHLE